MQTDDIVQSLEEVAREIEKIKRARDTHLTATHGRFNLFTTLLQINDEVRLHTRYLTHLLDPQGTHDCGYRFLKSFLEQVGLSDLTKQKCNYVAKEHYTDGDGNIDIYIEFESAIVVIENKIDAQDQDAQLERYWTYANSKVGTPYN